MNKNLKTKKARTIENKAYFMCRRILDNYLIDKRTKEKYSWPFMEPVDPKALDLPDYFDIIKSPMDLGTISEKLGKRANRCLYKTPDEFAYDVRLTFDNALLYNKADKGSEGTVYEAARELLNIFNKVYEEQYALYKANLAAAAERRDRAAAAQISDNNNTNTSTNNTSSSRPSNSSSNVGASRATGLTTNQRNACTEILTLLESTAQSEPWGWPLFFAPADRTIYKNYKIFVPRPLNLGTCTTRLKQRKGGFRNLNEFVKDVKRSIVNCLRYNRDPKYVNPLRELAYKMLDQFEESLMKQDFKELIDWRIEGHDRARNILSDLLATRTKSPEGIESQLVTPFLYPLDVNRDDGLDDYLTYITTPMDLGTVAEKLESNLYKNISEFISDVKLTFDNCITFWSMKGGSLGEDLVRMAREVLKVYEKSVDKHAPAGYVQGIVNAQLAEENRLKKLKEDAAAKKKLIESKDKSIDDDDIEDEEGDEELDEIMISGVSVNGTVKLQGDHDADLDFTNMDEEAMGLPNLRRKRGNNNNNSGVGSIVNDIDDGFAMDLEVLDGSAGFDEEAMSMGISEGVDTGGGMDLDFNLDISNADGKS